MSASVIRREFSNLNQLNGVSNEQERGRVFDYLVALLFSRINGVECSVKVVMDRGEVDVLADFTNTERHLHRLTGNLVPIENKWESKPTKQREIHIQHRKAELAALQSSCFVSCFVSMGGFTEDAEREIQNCQNPVMIPFEREEIIQLIESDNISEEFRKRLVQL